MRTFLLILLGLTLGYVLGAAAWAYGVMIFSPNTHDRVLEAQMTAAFIGGPICAVLGAIGGWVFAKRRK